MMHPVHKINAGYPTNEVLDHIYCNKRTKGAVFETAQPWNILKMHINAPIGGGLSHNISHSKPFVSIMLAASRLDASCMTRAETCNLVGVDGVHGDDTGWIAALGMTSWRPSVVYKR